MFSNRLKNLRIIRGMTQTELAAALGMAQGTIAMWESGKRQPDMDTVRRLCEYFGVSIDYLFGNSDLPSAAKTSRKGVRIPVLGQVAAGAPIDAIEDVIGYEEIAEDMAIKGDFFGLKIKGDSMEPLIMNGDTVIVLKQETIDDGQIAVVLVNGDCATVKRILRRPDGIMLIPVNTKYNPVFYSNPEILSLPVTIIGRVVEQRRTFDYKWPD